MTDDDGAAIVETALEALRDVADHFPNESRFLGTDVLEDLLAELRGEEFGPLPPAASTAPDDDRGPRDFRDLPSERRRELVRKYGWPEQAEALFTMGFPLPEIAERLRMPLDLAEQYAVYGGRCRATRKDGKPCRARAAGHYCRQHGGRWRALMAEFESDRTAEEPAVPTGAVEVEPPARPRRGAGRRKRPGPRRRKPDDKEE